MMKITITYTKKTMTSKVQERIYRRPLVVVVFYHQGIDNYDHNIPGFSMDENVSIIYANKIMIRKSDHPATTSVRWERKRKLTTRMSLERN